MLTSLIYMTVDSIYLFYWLLKNSIHGAYYFYCYLTGHEASFIEVSTIELTEIKNKMENQDKMLIELTELLKDKNSNNNSSHVNHTNTINSNSNDIEQIKTIKNSSDTS